MLEELTLEKIQQHIRRQHPVHVFESVASTNTLAAEMAQDGAGHGTGIFACHQTQGKGRLGRTFASPDSSGIYMSVILEPSSSNVVLITTAAAVAVSRAIEKICNQSPSIKWVNDLYLNNKKICGILAEAVTDHKTGTITRIVLGIGINCHSEALPQELEHIAGAIDGDYSINQLAAEVYNQLMDLANDLDPENFIDEYKDKSMVIGKNITVYKGGYSENATGTAAHVLNIDNNGGLVVLYSSGQQETLSTGEISIRL